MKIASLVKFFTPLTTFEVYPDGSESAALFYGGRKVMSIGRIRTGNFGEALGLAEKLRRHLANDSLLAEADSETVIPFGCEYRAKRHWKFSGNTVEMTGDISADNGGRIKQLALEDVSFTFDAEKVEILLDGEKQFREFPASEGVIYDGEILPVLVKVTAKEGFAAEFYSGDDFWRHNCAKSIAGASARYQIVIKDGEVHFDREVLNIPEEVESEKRPWRFKALFAVGKTEKISGFTADAVLESNGCFATPASHRDLRNFIRKTSGKAALLKVSAPLFCEDGSHISRPGKKVCHGSLGELFDEYIWAASVMARKDGNFVIDCNIPEIPGSVIAGNLGIVPEIIEEDGEE